METNNKIEQYKIPELSLLGGPLHKLGCRLGLVRNETNTVRLGIALSILTWGILVMLSFLVGKSNTVFSLNVIGSHVRLLVAIPLLFMCETLVAPKMAAFVQNIVRSGLVPEDERHSLASDIAKINRLTDSWIAETIFLLIAFAFPLLETIISVPGRTGNWEILLTENGSRFGLILVWYIGFCLPLFRFLLLRWIWRMCIWWYFLWRLKNLKLHLIPTHSDGAGGIGYLEAVQEHFIPMILAIAAVYSASFAENIVAETMAFETLYRYFLVLLVIIAIIFIGPLFIFFYKLWVCRSTGLSEYTVMTYRYVNAFDRKWIRNEKASGENQLGTPDMQSLADLTNSVNVIRGMRWIPVSKRLLIEFAISLMLPLLPLVFFKHPINQLAEKLFQILIGP